MEKPPDLSWLPPLVPYDEEGDWDEYLERVYAIFKKDFIDSRPMFRGVRLGLKRHPEIDGKAATFWHMISDGPEEAKRVTKFERCAPVAWPRAVIDAAGDASRVNCWAYRRGREDRIGLALKDFSYLVVLADRGDYVLPWTAYFVKDSMRSKYQAEWEKGPLK